MMLLASPTINKKEPLTAVPVGRSSRPSLHVGLIEGPTNYPTNVSHPVNMVVYTSADGYGYILGEGE